MTPSPRKSGTPPGSVQLELGALQQQRTRVRSFAFVEREGERWTVFLMTFPDERGRWRGYFAFRSSSLGSTDLEDVRTADLFVESSEAEVDARARSLGRPLLLALLESALHTRQQRLASSPDTRQWFRELLAKHSAELVAEISAGTDHSLSQLQSLYASYRLDQVAHLIALIEPDRFTALCDRFLDGHAIDFQATDRLQLAMMVVQELEQLLRLPPFELWLADYLAHRDEYLRYTHALHREGALP